MEWPKVLVGKKIVLDDSTYLFGTKHIASQFCYGEITNILPLSSASLSPSPPAPPVDKIGMLEFTVRGHEATLVTTCTFQFLTHLRDLRSREIAYSLNPQPATHCLNDENLMQNPRTAQKCLWIEFNNKLWSLEDIAKYTNVTDFLAEADRTYQVKKLQVLALQQLPLDMQAAWKKRPWNNDTPCESFLACNTILSGAFYLEQRTAVNNFGKIEIVPRSVIPTKQIAGVFTDETRNLIRYEWSHAPAWWVEIDVGQFKMKGRNVPIDVCLVDNYYNKAEKCRVLRWNSRLAEAFWAKLVIFGDTNTASKRRRLNNPEFGSASPFP